MILLDNLVLNCFVISLLTNKIIIINFNKFDEEKLIEKFENINYTNYTYIDYYNFENLPQYSQKKTGKGYYCEICNFPKKLKSNNSMCFEIYKFLNINDNMITCKVFGSKNGKLLIEFENFKT